MKHSIAPSASVSRILDLLVLPDVSVARCKKAPLLYSLQSEICAYDGLRAAVRWRK